MTPAAATATRPTAPAPPNPPLRSAIDAAVISPSPRYAVPVPRSASEMRTVHTAISARQTTEQQGTGRTRGAANAFLGWIRRPAQRPQPILDDDGEPGGQAVRWSAREDRTPHVWRAR